MPDRPLSDDEIEMKLQEHLRQLRAMRAETPEGAEALRIASVGPFSALLRLARAIKARAGT